jgi:hypothetical protein
MNHEPVEVASTYREQELRLHGGCGIGSGLENCSQEGRRSEIEGRYLCWKSFGPGLLQLARLEVDSESQGRLVLPEYWLLSA